MSEAYNAVTLKNRYDVDIDISTQTVNGSRVFLKPTQEQTDLISAAINTGAQRYFDSCESRVRAFSKQHYTYPGTWNINTRAFGWDLLKMPANLMWTPLYLLTQLIGYICLRLKWNRIARLIKCVPSGFITAVQSRIRDLIYTELLGSPSHPEKCELYRFISDEILQTIPAPSHTAPEDWDQATIKDALPPLIAQILEQYSITRTASADIANTVITTAAGAIVLKQFTPGGLGLGIIVATIYIKTQMASNFIFGETLGTIYYSAFPPEPSLGTIALSTLIVMCGLAIVAAFSGLITDPIQYYLRIHQRRLRKMLKHMAKDFKQQSKGSFHPKDQYLARIMELVDAFKTHVI